MPSYVILRACGAAHRGMDSSRCRDVFCIRCAPLMTAISTKWPTSWATPHAVSPHGDASIGDALVQPRTEGTSHRYQGNWGNILTGDSAGRTALHRGETVGVCCRDRVLRKITQWMPSYDGRKAGAGDSADEIPAAPTQEWRYSRRPQFQDSAS